MSLAARLPVTVMAPACALMLSLTAVGAMTRLAVAVAQLVGEAFSQIW
ncbi:hypothetical protein [Stenotrophomonas cyclobalanopsidis]